MGVTQSTDLNYDTEGVPTTGTFGDAGAGTSRWFHWFRSDELGARADAEAASATATASLISLIKFVAARLSNAATGILKAEDAAHTSGDTGVMVLGVRRDTMAASSGTTGDYEPLQLDSNGRLRTVDNRVGALLNARTTALDDILLVKASAGTLFGFQGYTTADGFVVVIADADGTISPGAQCLEVIKVTDPTGGAAGATFSFDAGRYGIAVSTGICIAFSSTGPTFTNGGTNMFVSAQYE